jgi:hypothetical protein
MPVSGTLATLSDITTTQITGTLAPAKGGLGTNAIAFNGVVKADGAGNFSASSVTNSDISATAAIDYSKLNIPAGTIDATKIATGVVDNNEFNKLNLVGSNGPGAIVSTDGTQTLSNKMMFEAKIDNFLDFYEEAKPAVPGGGLMRVYAKSDKKLYKLDDTGVESEIGAGGAGTGRNYLQDWYDATKVVSVSVTTLAPTANRTTDQTLWAQSTVSGLTIQNNTSSPLRQAGDFLVNSFASTIASFVESPLFGIDSADLGKPLSVEFDITGIAASTSYDVVVVRYNSSGTYQETISVAGNASTGTPASAQLPTGTTKFRGFFIPSATSTDLYGLRLRKVAAVDDDFQIDSLFVGPQSLAQAAVVTGGQDYTGAITGGGSATYNYVSRKWRRVGDSVQVNWYFSVTATGSGASNLLLPLPTGMTVDFTKTSNGQIIGSCYRLSGGTKNAAFTPRVVTGTLNAFVIETSSGSILTGSAVVSGEEFNLTATIAIAEWSSGTTTLADRAVEEYAFNTSTWDSTDNTTSFFGYGPAGSAISGALSNTQTKRVRFTTPILPTDRISVEFSDDRISWKEAPFGGVTAGIIQPLIYDGSNYIGGGGIENITASNTDVSVRFGRYRIGGNINWANGGYWRARKVSGGAAVGFPIAPANITLLDTTDNYSGNTKLGLMQYRHGFAGGYFGGIAPTVTCPQAGFTVLRAVFVPYQMADGVWRLKFNLQGDFTSATVQTITVSVNGILMSTSYTQSISAIYGGNSTGLKSYALINSNQLQTTTTASLTANGVCLSGDVELSAKPTWAY